MYCQHGKEAVDCSKCLREVLDVLRDVGKTAQALRMSGDLKSGGTNRE